MSYTFLKKQIQREKAKARQMAAWRHEFLAGIEGMEKERDQLRVTGQRLFKALEVYADEANWWDGKTWRRDEPGADVARLAIGLQQGGTEPIEAHNLDLAGSTPAPASNPEPQGAA